MSTAREAYGAFSFPFEGDGRVRRWDPVTGRELETAMPAVATDIVSAYGRLFAAFAPHPPAEKNLLRLWDAATGVEVGRLDSIPAIPQNLCLSSDGKLLRERPFHWRIARLWNMATGELAQDLDVDQNRLAAMVLSPGGSVVAAGGYNGGVVRRWNTRTGQELSRLTTPHRMVLALALARGGKVLATGGQDEPVYLWDTGTRTQMRQFAGPGAGVVPRLELSADAGKLLVVGGGRATLWSVATGGELTRFDSHDCPITAAALSPDRRLAATAGEDTTILVWDLTGGQPAPRELSAEDLDHLWSDLTDADSRKAYRAVGTLTAVARQAVSFLAERIRREELTQPLADESQKLDRFVRALRALERIHTAEARQLVAKLASGPPESQLTREARLTLRYLDRSR